MKSFCSSILVVVSSSACAGAPAGHELAPLPDPCVITADAAAPPATRPTATLADVAWLVGDWVGEGFGSQVEEAWWPARHGAMSCMFRLHQGGRLVFYELCTINEVEGSLELRIRHFGADLVGWEDRTQVQTFGLERLDANTAWFDGITYHRQGADRLRVWVSMRNKEGGSRIEEFVYRRRDPRMPVAEVAIGEPDAEVEATLDAFHHAAATGDEHRYFAILPEDAVFLGTDPGERWTGSEFKKFAMPYFQRDAAWIYEPRERWITVPAGGRWAYFDEMLHNDAYGTCRGSGVCERRDDGWVILQYNLSIPVPNDLAGDLVARIRAMAKK